jgi:hypothetical protein
MAYFLSNQNTFSDETVFFLSTTYKFHEMIELGPKNSWSDQIRKSTDRAKTLTRWFCNHYYSLSTN